MPRGGVASSDAFLGSSLPTLCPIDQLFCQEMTDLENRYSNQRLEIYTEDVIMM